MNNALTGRGWFKRGLTPFRIVAIYVAVGGLWILFSDQLLAGVVSDLVTLARLQTLKGWFYVLVMAGLLYVLICRHEAALLRAGQVLERRVEERTRELSTLLAVAHTVASTLELDPLLNLILEKLEDVVDYGGASIMIIQGEELIIRAHRGPIPQEEALRMRFSVKQTLPQKVIRAWKPVIIPDVLDDTALAHAYQAVVDEPLDYIRSWIGVPLIVKGQAIGVLTLGYSEPDRYSPQDADLVMALAHQATVAIENVWLYRDLQGQMEEFKRAQIQLVQSAKLAAIGELAAGVAHELNNPLTVVLGFAELLLRDTAPDDPARHDLSTVVAQAARTRDIVRGLLDFARQTEFHMARDDVNDVMEDTRPLFRRHLESSGIAVEERYAADLPFLLLDAGRMKQVFLNLTTNASHAMPRGGTLTVTSERVGDEVAVRVADMGEGIPAQHLSRIFDPFFTTRPVGQGTGLGLSVSQSIVQDHGGRIEVESQAGEGSTFTVWLPVGGVSNVDVGGVSDTDNTENKGEPNDQ